MKYSSFALVASFATTILASPYHMVQHEERDVVVVTKTDVHVDEVQVTRWVTAGAPEETTAVTVTASSSSEDHKGNHRNGANNHWSWSHSDSSAPVVVSTSAPVEAPAAPTPTPTTTSTQAPPPPPPSSTPSSTPSSAQAIIPAITSAAAAAVNNVGTATAGLTYTAPASPYPTPSSVVTDGSESYNPFDGNLQQGSLDATNSWRQKYGAKPVAWNYTLEQQLIDINTNKFGSKCVFEHHVDGSGQNIAAGYGSPKSAIDGWGHEVDHATASNFTNGDWGNGLHFSQLVWQDTTSIACAAINCDGYKAPHDQVGGWFYACNYYPAGNMGGEYKDNVKSG